MMVLQRGQRSERDIPKRWSGTMPEIMRPELIDLTDAEVEAVSGGQTPSTMARVPMPVPGVGHTP